MRFLKLHLQFSRRFPAVKNLQVTFWRKFPAIKNLQVPLRRHQATRRRRLSVGGEKRGDEGSGCCERRQMSARCIGSNPRMPSARWYRGMAHFARGSQRVVVIPRPTADCEVTAETRETARHRDSPSTTCGCSHFVRPMRRQDRNVYHPKPTRGSLVSLLGRLLLLYIAGRADVKIKIYWAG